MKKSIIITVGIVLILMVLGVWAYLLFFGTPENSDDVFANLGFGGQDTTIIDQEPITLPEEDLTQLGPNTDALRQLTTKPVAGFAFISTSTSLIRYVERGTGHIFEIDLDSGTEIRVSGTTIPRVVDAVFSPDGGAVALSSENGYGRDIVAGVIDLDNTSVNYINLPSSAFSPKFVSNRVVNYAVTTDGGTDGYELDIQGNEPVRNFSVPLKSIEMIWGDKYYLYNRPTAQLTGSLYLVNDLLSPVVASGFGLVAGVNSEYYLVSQNDNDELVSYATKIDSNEKIPLAIAYIPEKCTAVDTDADTLWCALPFDALSGAFLENWYQGAVQSEDVLWKLNISSEEARLISDFTLESGRIVDVDQISTDSSGQEVIFRNKINSTLWLYDTRLE